MEWTTLLGPGIAVGIVSLISAVWVARIGQRQAAETSLPAHFNQELERLTNADTRKQERLDAVERYLVDLGDHIDLLEAHIWQGLPPPPPPRPRFKPAKEVGDDRDS